VSRKNCNTCKHLEWHDDDTDGFCGPNSGYACGKRAVDDSVKAERQLLAKLAQPEYRDRYKCCFEARAA